MILTSRAHHANLLPLRYLQRIGTSRNREERGCVPPYVGILPVHLRYLLTQVLLFNIPMYVLAYVACGDGQNQRINNNALLKCFAPLSRVRYYTMSQQTPSDRQYRTILLQIPRLESYRMYGQVSCIEVSSTMILCLPSSIHFFLKTDGDEKELNDVPKCYIFPSVAGMHLSEIIIASTL